MNRFLKRFFLVVLLFYGLLLLLQTYIDYQLRKSTSNTYYDWNLLMNGKMNASIIILGNSRAQAHFDTRLIEKNTGVSTYNLGTSGASLAIDQIRMKTYLSHNNPPKIVIQNIDLYALTDKPIAEKNQYLPYFDDPVLFDELQKIDRNVVLEKYIPMSKYRNYVCNLYEELICAKNKTNSKYKGYHPHPNAWNNDFLKMKKEMGSKKQFFPKNKIDHQLRVLQEDIRTCKEIDATLILVWCPQYFELNYYQQPTLQMMKNKMRQIALDNKHVLFWDYTENQLNFEKKYFYNSFHMNTTGATIFSQEFSNSLHNFIEKTTP